MGPHIFMISLAPLCKISCKWNAFQIALLLQAIMLVLQLVLLLLAIMLVFFNSVYYYCNNASFSIRFTSTGDNASSWNKSAVK